MRDGKALVLQPHAQCRQTKVRVWRLAYLVGKPLIHGKASQVQRGFAPCQGGDVTSVPAVRLPPQGTLPLWLLAQVSRFCAS